MLRQRLDVAGDGAAKLLGLARLLQGGHGIEERQHAGERGETVAGLGHQPVMRGNIEQPRLQVVRRTALVLGAVAEDLLGKIVEAGDGMLQDLRRAVGDGLEQAGEHHRAVGAAADDARQAGAEEVEGLGLVVAHGDQLVAREHEGNVGDIGMAAIGAADERGCHEHGVRRRIHAARRLDILEVVAGGNLDLEKALDQVILSAIRAQHVDPDDILGHGGCRRGGIDDHRLAPGVIDSDHGMNLVPRPW